MEPKDLRTLRRPLNVVAMKAPVSLRFVSEADIQRADYQPSDLGICAALGSYEGSAMPDPFPSQWKVGRKRQNTPWSNNHRATWTSACLRHRNRHIFR